MAIGLLLILSLTSCHGSPIKTEQCDGLAIEKEARYYATRYAESLEQIGNLKQRLHACEVRK